MNKKKGKSDGGQGVAAFNRDSDLSFAAEAPGGPGRSRATSTVVPSCGDPNCYARKCVEEASGETEGLEGAIESLVQVVFPCKPGEVLMGHHQDSWHPGGLMAFWDHEDLVVADPATGDKMLVICYEEQHRASSRPYYTWYCAQEQPDDPATEDYMERISS
jgi:hypothetical protein